MKKTLAVVLALTGIVTACLAFRKDDPGYKNLKILPQDITPQQLDSVMAHFSDALNVSCDFCHVKPKNPNDDPDYASDDNKHKLVARQMMEMTYEINDKYFDYTGAKRTIETPLMVTCYSCHNGNKVPETQAPQNRKD